MGSPNITSFPDDNIRRVVWWYGPVIKNPYQSEVPLAEILTRTIKPDGSLSKQSNVRRVPMSELDIVKIGSIWQGRSRTETLWEPTEEKQFSFDFSLHAPESIRFNDTRHGTNQYYVPANAYWLGEIVNGSKYHFFNSTLTKLQSNSNTTVLVPALEFLTGAVSPTHKQIRYKLLQMPLDQLTDTYLKEAYVEGNRYVIRSKENHYDENFTLLAYLRLNQISHSRLSRLWPSVEKTNLMPNGKPYEDRYPEVLPYHPSGMTLVGDGIWIDKDTFLMLRITGVSSPQDYIINPIKTEYKTKTTDNQNPDNGSQNYSPDEVDPEDLDVDEENDSHWPSGVAYIRSNVKRIGPSTPLTITTEENEIEKPRPPHNREDKQDATGLSSGDPNHREDSSGNATLKQDPLEHDDTPSIDSGDLLKRTVSVLNQLIDDKTSNVSGFTFINMKGQKSKKTTYWHFRKSMTEEEVKGRWHIAKKTKLEGKKPRYNFRRFLIVKIVLENNESAYLLEIERRSQNEAFSGLLFNIAENDISTNSIIKLLLGIVDNKGRYSANSKASNKTLELPVDRYLVFKHMNVLTSLKNAIKRATNKGVFS